jgi:PAS domain S-box-containing protein
MKIRYFSGHTREFNVVDEEIPYPEGRLIVSRTTTRGIITHANSAFVEMSGYEAHELIGADHSLLRHPDMPKEAFRDLWSTVLARRKWQGFVKNLRKDGRFYWVLATVIPNIRKGQIQGFTSVRRKPSRRKIDEIIPVYEQMRFDEERSI